VDTGKIRYALLDLPLPMHKLAFKAAEASHCAADQGKFWEMHDSMMADQNALDALGSYAESIHLDIAQFQECLDSDKYADAVRQDMAKANQLGVTGTPSFVLASTNPEDPSKVKGLRLIRGAQPFSNFEQAIDQVLAEDQQ
jgi:protein-disulfide isomerase